MNQQMNASNRSDSHGNNAISATITLYLEEIELCGLVLVLMVLVGMALYCMEHYFDSFLMISPFVVSLLAIAIMEFLLKNFVNTLYDKKPTLGRNVGVKYWGF